MLVSCGFDAHFADLLAGMSLSVAGYGELASRLTGLADELCDGRLIVALEGGYDLRAIAWGTRATIETMLGEAPASDPLGPAPAGSTPDVRGLLEEVRAAHSID
jgi:acetoin utilization deacetylase AcuC-like enzyme